MPPSGPSAVVVAGDEETRVLLRGLLRLHHCRVLGEAGGASHAIDLVTAQRPRVLVADVNLSEGSFSQLLLEGRRIDPELRIILVLPNPRARVPMPDGVRADALLYRPFRIREFAEALFASSPTGSDPLRPA